MTENPNPHPKIHKEGKALHVQYGEMTKFDFCEPSFLHSLTKNNYIVCDFCRSLTEHAVLVVHIALYSNPTPLTDSTNDLPQKSQKHLPEAFCGAQW